MRQEATLLWRQEARVARVELLPHHRLQSDVKELLREEMLPLQ